MIWAIFKLVVSGYNLILQNKWNLILQNYGTLFSIRLSKFKHTWVELSFVKLKNTVFHVDI